MATLNLDAPSPALQELFDIKPEWFDSKDLPCPLLDQDNWRRTAAWWRLIDRFGYVITDRIPRARQQYLRGRKCCQECGVIIRSYRFSIDQCLIIVDHTWQEVSELFQSELHRLELAARNPNNLKVTHG